MTNPREAETIAGRYRLVRFLAQGGMGDVWEALDERLGQQVALKMIRRDLLSRPTVMERFRRETSLARRVTHPNVCRIYDIGEHLDPRTGETLVFLTMELLEGPTLEAYLRKRGRLSAAEALPIVRDMAEGLAAAHEAGVVHRDFKSANVILAPGPHGTRAVVTDFGLARAALEEGTALGLTSVDATVGTPAYMSPEQAEGTSVTPRSDLYSLGVVLYEMVTGAWPHSAPTPMATLLKRLKEPPPSPATIVPDLDPRWTATILRCLAVVPSERFGGAREIVAALTGSEVPPVPASSLPTPLRVTPVDSQPTRSLHRSPTRSALVAVAVLALVAAGAVLLLRGRDVGGGGAGLAGAPPRRVVAVLGFKNLSQRPEAAWLSTALSEMLTAEVAAGGTLRTVPGESVARMRRELGLPETDGLAGDTLSRIRKLIGADLVVLGSYLAVPGEPGEALRLVVTVQDAHAGETAATVTESGTVADVLGLVTRAGGRVRQALGSAEPSPARAGEAHAGFSRNPEALRLYAEGLDALRALDPRSARDAFLKAVETDPENPLAHAALAQSWADLGYDARAVASARKAFELSSSLPREERLFVEGRKAEMERDWDRAIESYRTLFGFFPDNLEYGLRLGSAQSRARRPAETMKTLAALKALPPPSSEDARIDLVEAEAAHGLSQFASARDAAERAAAKARQTGARLLLAQAQYHLTTALTRLGQAPAGRAACEESRRAFAAAGDRGGEARALDRLGAIVYEEGSYAQARLFFVEALSTWRKIGHAAGAGAALNNAADCLQMQGDLTAARPLYEEALALHREIGDRSLEAISLVNLAALDLESGDVESARALGRQAVSVAEPTGMRYALAAGRFVSGETELLSGDARGAAADYEATLGLARAAGDRRLAAFALASLGEAALLSDRLDEARSRLDQALAIRSEIGNRTEEAQSRLALGLLELRLGRAAEAVPHLTAAAATFGERGVASREARARSALARALTAAGKEAEAAAALASATKLLRAAQHVPLRLRGQADVGWVVARNGGLPAARVLLGEAATEARERKLLVPLAELLLVRAGAERLAGRPREAEAALAEAERAAAGLPLLARLAREERELPR